MSIKEVFLDKLPKHKCSLTLDHNDHKNYYSTVAKFIEDKRHGYIEDDWVNPEQMQLAIETDECWTLQWYPDTPIGFYIVSAATFEALLNHMSKEENLE